MLAQKYNKIKSLIAQSEEMNHVRIRICCILYAYFFSLLKVQAESEQGYTDTQLLCRFLNRLSTWRIH